MREIEARCADQSWLPVGHRIDPHHLTTAKKELLGSGQIVSTVAKTRGGHLVELFSLPPRRGLKTKIEKVSARKRILVARHNSWARADKRYPQGLVGPAAEEAVWNALAEDQQHYALGSNPRQEVTTALGINLNDVGGPLDALAYLTLDTAGIPQHFTVLIEVKNYRQWIYPDSVEVHRFLHKATELQLRTDADIVPVFMSRKRSNSLLKMGMQLGFYAVEFRRQWIRPVSRVDENLFAEVRDELGFEDLARNTIPNNSLRRALDTSIPRDAPAVSERWKQTAELTAPFWAHLRDPKLTNHNRRTTLADLRTLANHEYGRGGW